MRLWHVLAAWFVLLVCSTFAAQPASTGRRIRNVESGLVELDLARIRSFFQSEHQGPSKTLAERMAHYAVPGVAVAVIDDFKVAWAKGYGVTRAGGGTPVTTDTCFEAGSTSKLLASVIALRFVEQGRLGLDEDVNRKLNSWRIPESEFTRAEKVTLRRLLTHRSGFNRPDGGMGYESGGRPSLLQVLKGEPPALNKPASIEYTPGSRWQYSNLGYVVLQLLLEDVTGKDYRQLAREALLEPLGLKDSTFIHPLEPAFRKRVALPHDEEGKAHDREQQPIAVAHGGLVTTPTDLARFAIGVMEAFQGRSDRILSTKTARQMLSSELELPDQVGIYVRQGLGVLLEGQGDTLYFLFAGENAPGAISLLIASPVTGQGAVLMSNGARGALLHFEILSAIMNEYRWPIAQ